MSFSFRKWVFMVVTTWFSSLLSTAGVLHLERKPRSIPQKARGMVELLMPLIGLDRYYSRGMVEKCKYCFPEEAKEGSEAGGVGQVGSSGIAAHSGDIMQTNETTVGHSADETGQSMEGDASVGGSDRKAMEADAHAIGCFDGYMEGDCSDTSSEFSAKEEDVDTIVTNYLNSFLNTGPHFSNDQILLSLSKKKLRGCNKCQPLSFLSDLTEDVLTIFKESDVELPFYRVDILPRLPKEMQPNLVKKYEERIKQEAGLDFSEFLTRLDHEIKVTTISPKTLEQIIAEGASFALSEQNAYKGGHVVGPEKSGGRNIFKRSRNTSMIDPEALTTWSNTQSSAGGDGRSFGSDTTAISTPGWSFGNILCCMFDLRGKTDDKRSAFSIIAGAGVGYPNELLARCDGDSGGRNAECGIGNAFFWSRGSSKTDGGGPNAVDPFDVPMKSWRNVSSDTRRALRRLMRIGLRFSYGDEPVAVLQEGFGPYKSDSQQLGVYESGSECLSQQWAGGYQSSSQPDHEVHEHCFSNIQPRGHRADPLPDVHWCRNSEGSLQSRTQSGISGGMHSGPDPGLSHSTGRMQNRSPLQRCGLTDEILTCGIPTQALPEDSSTTCIGSEAHTISDRHIDDADITMKNEVYDGDMHMKDEEHDGDIHMEDKEYDGEAQHEGSNASMEKRQHKNSGVGAVKTSSVKPEREPSIENSRPSTKDDLVKTETDLVRAGIIRRKLHLMKMPNPREYSPEAGILGRLVIPEQGREEQRYGLRTHRQGTPNVEGSRQGTPRSSLKPRSSLQFMNRESGTTFHHGLITPASGRARQRVSSVDLTETYEGRKSQLAKEPYEAQEPYELSATYRCEHAATHASHHASLRDLLQVAPETLQEGGLHGNQQVGSHTSQEGALAQSRDWPIGKAASADRAFPTETAVAGGQCSGQTAIVEHASAEILLMDGSNIAGATSGGSNSAGANVLASTKFFHPPATTVTEINRGNQHFMRMTTDPEPYAGTIYANDLSLTDGHGGDGDPGDTSGDGHGGDCDPRNHPISLAGSCNPTILGRFYTPATDLPYVNLWQNTEGFQVQVFNGEYQILQKKKGEGFGLKDLHCTKSDYEIRSDIAKERVVMFMNQREKDKRDRLAKKKSTMLGQQQQPGTSGRTTRAGSEEPPVPFVEYHASHRGLGEYWGSKVYEDVKPSLILQQLKTLLQKYQLTRLALPIVPTKEAHTIWTTSERGPVGSRKERGKKIKQDDSRREFANLDSDLDPELEKTLKQLGLSGYLGDDETRGVSVHANSAFHNETRYGIGSGYHEAGHEQYIPDMDVGKHLDSNIPSLRDPNGEEEEEDVDDAGDGDLFGINDDKAEYVEENEASVKPLERTFLDEFFELMKLNVARVPNDAIRSDSIRVPSHGTIPSSKKARSRNLRKRSRKERARKEKPQKKDDSAPDVGKPDRGADVDAADGTVDVGKPDLGADVEPQDLKQVDYLKIGTAIEVMQRLEEAVADMERRKAEAAYQAKKQAAAAQRQALVKAALEALQREQKAENEARRNAEMDLEEQQQNIRIPAQIHQVQGHNDVRPIDASKSSLDTTARERSNAFDTTAIITGRALDSIGGYEITNEEISGTALNASIDVLMTDPDEFPPETLTGSHSGNHLSSRTTTPNNGSTQQTKSVTLTERQLNSGGNSKIDDLGNATEIGSGIKVSSGQNSPTRGSGQGSTQGLTLGQHTSAPSSLTISPERLGHSNPIISPREELLRLMQQMPDSATPISGSRERSTPSITSSPRHPTAVIQIPNDTIAGNYTSGASEIKYTPISHRSNKISCSFSMFSSAYRHGVAKIMSTKLSWTFTFPAELFPVIGFSTGSQQHGSGVECNHQPARPLVLTLLVTLTPPITRFKGDISPARFPTKVEILSEAAAKEVLYF